MNTILYKFSAGGILLMHEKQKVALSSVFAAIFLTVIKIIVGVFTGSLGILSEAAHSTLDLGAALVTFFAVKIADKPADSDHNYGHGKVESFSALIETLLLLITCVWIVNEAIERLFFGKSVVVVGGYWGIGIMILSIIINISRAKSLKKVAHKYGSQALEADALHFDSDVWSSFVVIGGLICVEIGNYFKIAILNLGDPIAALGVSVLVIYVSVMLGKRTIDVLIDTAPKGMVNNILLEVNSIKGVLGVDSARIRPSGSKYFIDLNIGINRNESHRVVHSIVNEVRERLLQKIPNSDIIISTYPLDLPGAEDQEIYLAVKKIVDKFPICTNIHNIHVYQVSGEKYIAIHLEVKEIMTLNESHQLSHEISSLIEKDLADVKEVSVNFEFVKRQLIAAEDITEQSQAMINKINALINKAPDKLNCHDIKVYSQGERIAIFLHCGLGIDCTTTEIETISKEISNKIRNQVKNIESIHIHVEPIRNESFS